MRGRGKTVNSGPGFYNKSYSDIDACEGYSCESSDDYHGRRRKYGHRRRLHPQAYDISDLYH